MISIKYRPKVRQGGTGKVGRNFEEPQDELVRVFEEYLEQIDQEDIGGFEYYSLAYEITEDLDPDIESANNLTLVSPEDNFKFERKLGHFLSAIYNHSEEDLIVYNTESRHSPRIGYKLAEGKTLVLKSKTMDAGRGSKGTIINESEAYWGLCNESEGLCINAGKVYNTFGGGKGITINLNQVDKMIPGPLGTISLNFADFGNFSVFTHPVGAFISTKEVEQDKFREVEGQMYKDNPKSCVMTPNDVKDNQKLVRYLSELESGLDNSFNDILNFLDQLKQDKSSNEPPGQSIKQKIFELLGDSN